MIGQGGRRFGGIQGVGQLMVLDNHPLKLDKRAIFTVRVKNSGWQGQRKPPTAIFPTDLYKSPKYSKSKPRLFRK